MTTKTIHYCDWGWLLYDTAMDTGDYADWMTFRVHVKLCHECGQVQDD